ncbi:unnamed protein product, partial [Staurois parvus]
MCGGHSDTGGNCLGATDIPSDSNTVISANKSTDTVLIALGRKGLTCGAIKGLTVCCALHCKHTAFSCTLLCMALHSR